VDDRKSPACFLYLEYADSISRAGGVPLVLPPLERDVDRALEALDGILLSGGDDYDPRLYRQRRHESLRPIHPRRNRADPRLARRALRSGLPILGICGGLQLLNIVLGGDLIQDIESLVPGALRHRSPSRRRPVRHSIRIQPGTLLASVAGKLEASVNTFHHQAVGRVGRGLRVSAMADDGIVEGLEAGGGDPGRFLLGVQWHPERDPNRLNGALFRGLVEAARSRAMESRR